MGKLIQGSAWYFAANVSEENAASLKAHEKCGFRIVSEQGCDYLHQEADDRDFGLEYRYERP